MFMESSAMAEDYLPTFNVTYKLYTHGIEAGITSRSLTKTGLTNEYEYLSETRTTGLAALFKKLHVVEKSLFRLGTDALIPLTYSYQRQGDEPENESMKFDWDKMQLIKVFNGSTNTVSIPEDLSAPLDKLLYQYALMFDLNNGRIPDKYTVMDKRRIKTYDISFLGEEVVETPLGAFNTYKILRARNNKDKQTYLWCAKDLDYLPVKLDEYKKGENSSFAMIESISGFGL